MQALVSKGWRRWIGAFCAALLAFVLIEQASPAHTLAEAGTISYSAAATITDDGVSLSTVGDDGQSAIASDMGDAGKPLPPVGPAHHCCAAHTGSPAPAAQGGVVLAGSVEVSFIRDAQRAPQSAPSGLDRPPKASAII